MNVVKTIAEVRRAVAWARASGKLVGFVPTMGNLHAGHGSLIEAARGACGFVVVSIYVNPIQFGPGEDFASYPRTPEQDLELCQARGADAVFMPADEEMYPQGKILTEVSVPSLSHTLCGASRPGHFTGVCTVVAKLLNVVSPDRAFFGAKDFQQTVVLRRMVADLNFPAEIVVCPTVRESDGLAMSSRNSYLTAAERSQAPALHECLELARQRIVAGAASANEVAEAMKAHLAGRAPDGRIDYLKIIDPMDLRDVEKLTGPTLVAISVRFCKARLIDNILLQSPPKGG